MALFDFVQVKAQNGAHSTPLVFDTNVTSGNSLVICTEWGDSVQSITDGAGNTYVPCESRTWSGYPGGDFHFSIHLAANVVGGALSISFPGTGAYVTGVEYAGHLALDQKSSAHAQSQVIDSGDTPTTTAANELLVGLYANDAGLQTPGLSFTERAENGDGFTFFRGVADKVVAATAAYKITADTGSSFTRWAGIICTFKQATPPAPRFFPYRRVS